MAEWGLLGRPPELGRPPPDPGLAGLATPGFSRGVLAAPNALSNLPGTQQLLSFACVAVRANVTKPLQVYAREACLS